MPSIVVLRITFRLRRFFWTCAWRTSSSAMINDVGARGRTPTTERATTFEEETMPSNPLDCHRGWRTGVSPTDRKRLRMGRFCPFG